MPIPYIIFIYALVFIYGVVLGSFLNVCIYRIPSGESIVTVPSHCMKCGYKLKWYDLVPLFSYLFLRGRCRQCKTKISPQYFIVELLNGVLWVLTFLFCGIAWQSIIYCLFISVLVVISVIDWRTFEIPVGLNIAILVLGVAATALDLVLGLGRLPLHIIGFFAISVPLLLIYLVTKGRGIGGGDIKLMAAAGLLVGWKLAIVGFILGCLFAVVIHIAWMKISKQDHVLAFGPYLSAGLLFAVWFGERIVSWYLSFFSF